MIVTGLLLIFALGAGGLLWFFAWRSGASPQAVVVNALASALAPDQDAPGALSRSIREDRETGPAKPPGRLLRRIEFCEDFIGKDRVFRLALRNAGDTSLRLIYLHGGAYIHEVKAMQWNLAGGLMNRLSARVIAPVYPLAPEHTWREGLAAVERVYTTLLQQEDAENIVIFGDSAGGGLALALAQSLRDGGVVLPAALVLFSPWLDVGVSGVDQAELETRDPVLRVAYLRRAGQLWAGELPLNDPRVSPLFGNHKGLPPTIVFSGSRDVLDSDSLRLARVNPEIVHRHYPGMMHVWPAAPIPEGRRALDEAAAFIKEHMQ